MALVDDIIQAGRPDDGNNVVNYAAPTAPAATAAVADPTLAQMGDLQQRLSQRIVQQGNAALDNPTATAPAMRRAHPELDGGVAGMQQALNLSRQYAELMHSTVTAHHEAERNIAAGNILGEAHNISTTDPDYENKIGTLLQNNLDGADHPAVQDYLSMRNNSRKFQVAAVGEGGIHEFEPGSVGARSYKNTLLTTGGDAAAAQAAGKAAEGQHKQFLGLYADNAITSSDLPKIQEGQPLPTITDPTGRQISPYVKQADGGYGFNYPALINLGAARQGQRAEKENKLQNSSERLVFERANYAQKQLENYAPGTKERDQWQGVVDEANKVLLGLREGQAGASVKPAATPAPAKASSYIFKRSSSAPVVAANPSPSPAQTPQP